MANPLSLHEAAQLSSTLTQLTQRARASQQCLQAVLPLIPGALRCYVQAGPLEDQVWCLLVESGSAAAKLRQLVPDLLNRLNDRGMQITSIRLKIQSGQVPG